MNIIDNSAIRPCTSCQVCSAVCNSMAIDIRLNEDGFYRPYVDADKNYYKGTFTYTIETEKNAEYSDKKVKFIDIKAPVTEGMVDGTTLTPSADANMNLEMELFEDYDYDTSLILFYSSYNTYYCQR